MSPAHRFIAEPPRESALEAAKALLESSKDKTWQELVSTQLSDIEGRPYCERSLVAQWSTLVSRVTVVTIRLCLAQLSASGEVARQERWLELIRLSEEELDKSPMSYRDSIRVYRSRSVDLGFLSRESYLAQWNREKTPVRSQETYRSHVRRSYTPVREIAGIDQIPDTRHPLTSHRARTPLAMVTAPYHTNIYYRAEDQPFRKYDVFGLRTWSYPIYKYIYGRDQDHRRPYSYNSFHRQYGTTSLYTPPQLTPESRPITTRRGYSGYTYLASETNYDIASQPRSLKNYMYSRTYVGTTPAPSYWSYYGSSSLRHFNSYRPHNYTPSTASWSRYY